MQKRNFCAGVRVAIAKMMGVSGSMKAITNMAKSKLNSQSKAKKRSAPLNENIILINSSYQ